ncbi:hypothetical protein HMPREF9151_00375 [Hoylesella saccharolytica F0055]|uniref:Uncharacterized protein n=1 Tax=Hoylesella saccharolytica F0055 TaxID=1127699 RepID=L1NJT5_9BACT|nr:hypothetical protein HMPREF9151_00375 [Hoylesella saccharolytica F0055]
MILNSNNHTPSFFYLLFLNISFTFLLSQPYKYPIKKRIKVLRVTKNKLPLHTQIGMR